MKLILQSTSAVLLLAMVPSCERPAAPPKLSQEAAAQARRTIVHWLECEECTEGELDSVVKLGPVAVPTLTATLIEGPSPAKREEQRVHLVDLYRQQVDYAKSHPQAAPKLSEEEFVKLYAANLLALYRTRSAMALERIGGPAAADALQRALKLPLREDELAVIRPAASRTRP
jgi:hypothetical protein